MADRTAHIQAARKVLDPTELTLAGLYAQSLAGLFEEDHQAEDFYLELQSLTAALDEQGPFERLMTESLLSPRQKLALVRRVFAGRVSQVMENLLGVMAQHDRLGLLRQVVRRFRSELDSREGKLDVSVKTAVPLDHSQRDALAAELAAALGCEVLMEMQTDERLLGGMVLRIGDRVFDASIRKDLARLKDRMLQRHAAADHASNAPAPVQETKL